MGIFNATNYPAPSALSINDLFSILSGTDSDLAYINRSQSLRLSVVSKTTTYTITANDHVVLCDSSGGVFTVTLPAASGLSGHVVHVKKTDSSGNSITIEGNGSETIDDALNVDVSIQYESVMLATDGSNWYIL